MNVFIDSDHAGDKLTHCLRTGVLIFLNRALVTWFTKKQNGFEGGLVTCPPAINLALRIKSILTSKTR